MSRSPFFAGRSTSGIDWEYSDVTSRLMCVKNFSLRECEQALKMDDLQKTVRTAVERRKRKLNKTLVENRPIGEQSAPSE